MDALGQYVLSVTAASILCGLVKSMISGSRLYAFINSFCGLVLAVVIVKPLVEIDVNAIMHNLSLTGYPDAQSAVTIGSESRNQALSILIKQKTEAYILDRAESLNIYPVVVVTLDDGEIPVPSYVTIRGEISADEQQKLQSILEEELGISKERQQWIQ